MVKIVIFILILVFFSIVFLMSFFGGWRNYPVVVLHEYGSPSHYAGLRHLLQANESRLLFAEFGVLRQFVKGVWRRHWHLCARSLHNIGLLLYLALLSPRRRIVVGMAPFDMSILLLMPLLWRHRVFLHSSWPYWDATRQPHTPWPVVRGLVLRCWSYWMTHRVEHAFFVTRLAQVNNADSPFAARASSVVAHAFDGKAFHPPASGFARDGVVNIAYVGRLEASKGILDFLQIAGREYAFPVAFHIAGQGDCLAPVQAAVRRMPERIFYHGHIDNRPQLGDFFRQMDFLLNPAHRVDRWEELFGMTLIEGGACGVISWATAHPGPLEILRDAPAGGCLAEADFMDNVMLRIEQTIAGLPETKKNVADYFRQYVLEDVALRWRAVLAADPAEVRL